MNKTILAIETSCDETAAAVYTSRAGIRSSVLFSQTELHAQYGGVVPEIAARSHIEKIMPIVDQALSQASCSLNDIDVIGVTTKPGLPGSLLVGLSYAKAIAYARDIPFVAVDHIHAHILSPLLEHSVPFPYCGITASGGHTIIYYVRDYDDYDIIGQTRDDAAGEAFDKVAKLLNLGYPGGPTIEKLAADVDFQDFYHYPRGKNTTLDFSFSGLKTAVLYDLVERGVYDLQNKTLLTDDHTIKQHVASSLLVCIADMFINKLNKALRNYPHAQAITFAGGVACNQYIINRLREYAQSCGLNLYTPSKQYCTDNAAMIAFVATYYAQQERFNNLYQDILS